MKPSLTGGSLSQKLHKISHRKLVQAHNRLFLRSRFHQTVNRFTPRHQIESRIVQLYELTHGDENAPDWPAYRDHLVSQLSATRHDPYRNALFLVARNPCLHRRSINKMDGRTTDACLAVLGLAVDADARVRRRVLRLYFHGQVNRLATRKRQHAAELVRKQLDKNPRLNHAEFIKRFRDKYPFISATHFRNIKYHWTRRGRLAKAKARA